MKDKLEFDITLWAPDDYPNSAALTLPFDALEVFGTKGRVPVCFTVNGHTFRSTLAPMGGQHMMVFNLEMRQKTGFKAGDTIHITMERDTEPRVVEVPEDVMQALKGDAKALHAYEKYSYSHQKELIAWINDTQNPATRQKRILKLVDTLNS